MSTRGGELDCFVVCLAVDGWAVWFISSVDTQLLKFQHNLQITAKFPIKIRCGLRINDIQFVEHVFDDREHCVVVLCGQQFLEHIEQN